MNSAMLLFSVVNLAFTCSVAAGANRGQREHMPLRKSASRSTETSLKHHVNHHRNLADVTDECFMIVDNPEYIGDGFCDEHGGYNIPECGYDGGDCCESTCFFNLVEGSENDCPQEPMACRDPNTPEFKWPHCHAETFEDIADGFCDDEFNTPQCGYDGGDCCSSTCHLNMLAGAESDCSEPMNCKDPNSNEQHFARKSGPSDFTIYEEMIDLVDKEGGGGTKDSLVWRPNKNADKKASPDGEAAGPVIVEDYDGKPDLGWQNGPSDVTIYDEIVDLVHKENVDGAKDSLVWQPNEHADNEASPDDENTGPVLVEDEPGAPSKSTKALPVESQTPPDTSFRKSHISTIVGVTGGVCVGVICLLLLAHIGKRKRVRQVTELDFTGEEDIGAVKEAKTNVASKRLRPTLEVLDEENPLGSPNECAQPDITSNFVMAKKEQDARNATIDRHYNGGADSMQVKNDITADRHCKLEDSFYEGTKFVIYAPPGKLGLVLDNAQYNGHPVIHSIKDSSCIKGQVEIGDELIAVDEDDVRDTEALEVSRLISQRSQKQTRKLTIVRPSSEMKRESDSRPELVRADQTLYDVVNSIN